MNEGPPTGDIPEPRPQDQSPSEGFDQHHVDVSSPSGDELVVSTDLRASGSAEPPTESQPAQEYSVPNGSTEGEITTSVTDTSANSSDQPQEDTNPGASRVDEAKAEAMAYATKDFRGKAADNRDLAREQDQLDNMATEVEHLSEQGPSLLHPLRHRRHQKMVEGAELELASDSVYHSNNDIEADEQARRDMPELQHARDREYEAIHPIARDWRESDPYSPEERAKAYDAYADRIETWAGALHDRPLSAEFKKAHPGLQFQPKALVRMEDEVQRLGREITDKEGDTYRETEDVIKRITELPLWMVRDGDSANEHAAMRARLINQASAFDRFYNSRIDEVRIQPLRDQLAMNRNVLNDVRRAVGLPVEDQEPEADQQDQPQGGEPEPTSQDQPQSS